jgi:hypothetical protein
MRIQVMTTMRDKTMRDSTGRPWRGEADIHIPAHTPGYRLLEPASSIRQVQRSTPDMQGSLLPNVEASDGSTCNFVILCSLLVYSHKNSVEPSLVLMGY